MPDAFRKIKIGYASSHKSGLTNTGCYRKGERREVAFKALTKRTHLLYFRQLIFQMTGIFIRGRTILYIKLVYQPCHHIKCLSQWLT